MWKCVDPKEMKAFWAEALAGYSADELRAGIDKCKLRDWPPTLPEFLKLCRPPIDPEQAYIEAATQIYLRKEGKDKWSHPAIFWAAMSFGTHDLQASSWQTIGRRWTSALNAELAKGTLDEIPPFRDALPAPGRTITPPDEARSRIAELRAMLATKGNGADLPYDKTSRVELQELQ